MSAAPKTIGIIGGLGPAATLDLFAKIVAATPAERDQEHLRILIDNNPRIPDRNAAIRGAGPSPGPALAEAARGLERTGADFILIACNAAHAWRSEIESAISVPLISMIETAVDAASALARRPKRVGVLAADACLQARLYQDALAQRSIDAVILSGDEQARFMRLVYRVKAGELNASAADEMRTLALSLLDAGAEAIIAGCTEVPLCLDRAPQNRACPILAFQKPIRASAERGAQFAPALQGGPEGPRSMELGAPLIDSTDVLAARAVAFALGEK